MAETGDGVGLEQLPSALIATILTKLDVSSLCSVASTSTSLRTAVSQIFSFLPDFHLHDISPTVDLLYPLLPPNPHLRSLKVDCSRLNDSSISLLVNPFLHEIRLQNCENISGKLLSELGRQCGDLRFLSVGSEHGIHEIDIQDLSGLLCGCSKLESLGLFFDVSMFNRHSFAHVWVHASENLQALEIGFIPSVMMAEVIRSKAVIRPAYQSQLLIFPNLQKLCLSVDYISDALVTTISNGLVSLTHLDLQDAPIMEPGIAIDLTNSGLEQINPEGRLKHLSLVRSQEFLLTYFKRINDLGVFLMTDRCANLESICLAGFCRVTDAGIRAILHSCSNLHKLRVCHGTQLTNLVFHDISATSLSLTHVGLGWCHLLTNQAILGLVSNRDLIVLDLRNCRNLGDGAMRAIAELLRLQVLLLDGTDISDMSFSFFKQGLTSLTTISLRGCDRLTDECVSAISGSSLSKSLKVLDLSNLSNLTDNAILLLARSGTMIVELRLRECPNIGDSAVMALASMQMEGGRCGSSLKVLDIYESGKITALAYHWLKRPYFPRLRWLGLTGGVHRDLLVDGLSKNRPFLHLACRGEELETRYWDTSDGFCRKEHEEVDELEQFLLEWEDDSDDYDAMMD